MLFVHLQICLHVHMGMCIFVCRCVHARMDLHVCVWVVVADGCIKLTILEEMHVSVVVCFTFVCVPHFDTNSLLENLANKESLSITNSSQLILVLYIHFC